MFVQNKPQEMSQEALHCSQLAVPYIALWLRLTLDLSHSTASGEQLASLLESPASSAKFLSYTMSEVYLGVYRTMQSLTVSLTVTGQPKHAKMLNSSFYCRLFP